MPSNFTAGVEQKIGKDGKSTFQILTVKYRGVAVHELFVTDNIQKAMNDIDELITSLTKGGTPTK